ncbi:MAG: DMT family transporter [Synergistales bacterium]|nr:DMT family transporter [Synergistales bacterium]
MTAKQKTHASPLIVLGLGILAISTGAIFARFAEASPLVISGYRAGLAALILMPAALVCCPRELRNLSKRDLLYVIIAGVFLALHFITWITSLFFTTVASSVVLVETIPVWTAILSPFVTGDRVPRLQKIGIALSVGGAVIIGAGDFAIGGRAFTGDLLALAGALCATAYFLTGRVVRPKMSLLSYTAICYTSAAVVLWIIIAFLGLPAFGYSQTTWIAFWGMAIVSQILGHSSYNWALRYVTPSLVSVALLGEPIFSPIFAWFLLGEAVPPLTYLGGAFILTGIYVATRGEQKKKGEIPEAPDTPA